jgi:Tfp pilus assembly protein PilF
MAVIVAAQFHASAGNTAKAKQTYETFLAAKPNAPEVLNNLANLYLDPFKDIDRALDTARQARAVAPASGAIAGTLGWILYQKKAYAEALPLINEAATRIGHLAEVQYHVGMVSLRRGHDEAAWTALRLAVAGAGTNPGKDEASREQAALEKRLPAKAP